MHGTAVHPRISTHSFGMLLSHWGHHARSNEETTLDMVQKFLFHASQMSAYATTILLEDRATWIAGYTNPRNRLW